MLLPMLFKFLDFTVFLFGKGFDNGDDKYCLCFIKKYSLLFTHEPLRIFLSLNDYHSSVFGISYLFWRKCSIALNDSRILEG